MQDSSTCLVLWGNIHTHVSVFYPLLALLMPFFPHKTQQCIFSRQSLARRVLAVLFVSNKEPLCLDKSPATPCSGSMTPKALGLYSQLYLVLWYTHRTVNNCCDRHICPKPLLFSYNWYICAFSAPLFAISKVNEIFTLYTVLEDVSVLAYSYIMNM